ncbi:TLC domain-containing protein 4 isoform X1 [Pteronotus mesoamericanus]|uniref:TLC domain-containing protein 4 isoform X1 n=1 Tax=Pteronotus mesoamericanus TaxID=1884717 RepID=UPI0023EC2777|nr:TLC domain-containing protein 4 isoform X1 [Pteronotus parnellii mesoamericanus]XP_054421006.1 TLC domain-containing protein 4 isoform X1 [Pteronotus parnellii mesoamericanus]XP_054421007.1 TLC domain-containing protein 4 isoform X1 [Pteronotus parnellii mesoamericanus]XP_054421008.1 TLC domain-containing protein 4 isoform X1 [Pteronotus parnellii mesoamericanus]
MDAFAYYTLPAGTALASFCTFQLLFHVLSSWFSAKVSPGFNNLSFEKKIEWNSRVVSTCHSLLVGILGLYIVFFDEVVIADPLWGHSSLAQMNIAVTSGYLVSDLLALFLYWRVIGDKYFVIHHCTSLYAFFIIMVVPGNPEVPQVLRGQRGQRRAHDGRVLPRAGGRHPAVLRLHVLGVRHRGLRAPRADHAVLLARHLRRAGRDEHHVDGQNLQGLPQGPLALQAREGQPQAAEREAGLRPAERPPSAPPTLGAWHLPVPSRASASLSGLTFRKGKLKLCFLSQGFFSDSLLHYKHGQNLQGLNKKVQVSPPTSTSVFLRESVAVPGGGPGSRCRGAGSAGPTLQSPTGRQRPA